MSFAPCTIRALLLAKDAHFDMSPYRHRNIPSIVRHTVLTHSYTTTMYSNFWILFCRCLLFILSPRLHHSSPRVYMLGCQQQLLTMNTHSLRYAVLHACMLLHCLRVLTLTYACTINSLTISSPSHSLPTHFRSTIYSCVNPIAAVLSLDQRTVPVPQPYSQAGWGKHSSTPVEGRCVC